MSQSYTLDEVGKNKSGKAIWIVVDKKVYDVSSYLKEHPGGPAILKNVGGTDATRQFYEAHEPTKSNVKKVLKKLHIGVIVEKKKEKEADKPSAKKGAKKKQAPVGTTADELARKAAEELQRKDQENAQRKIQEELDQKQQDEDAQKKLQDELAQKLAEDEALRLEVVAKKQADDDVAWYYEASAKAKEAEKLQQEKHKEELEALEEQ